MKAKFTLHDFLRDFYTTAQCLEYLASLRWPDSVFCRKCNRPKTHYLRVEQHAYSCTTCGTLRTPTEGTIFYRSNVKLQDWFWVVFQMSKTRTGITAKQIERELAVSYKTALRMCNKVRSALSEERHLSGQVELDETYMGNSARYARGKRKRGRGTMKAPVFGAVERGGAVVAKVVPDTKRDTVMPIVRESVERYSEVFTDEYAIYNTLDEEGYLHDTVRHGAREYVKYRKEIKDDGSYETTEVHTNTMEGFWSYPKIATKGVHRGVSDHKLQGYVDEYSFRHSHRNDEEEMFFTMLRQIVPVEPLPLAA